MLWSISCYFLYKVWSLCFTLLTRISILSFTSTFFLRVLFVNYRLYSLIHQQSKNIILTQKDNQRKFLIFFLCRWKRFITAWNCCSFLKWRSIESRGVTIFQNVILNNILQLLANCKSSWVDRVIEAICTLFTYAAKVSDRIQLHLQGDYWCPKSQE